MDCSYHYVTFSSAKQGEMLKLLYEAMYGVLKPAFANLESGGFTPSSPFPHDQPNHLDSLSLIYENCALFSELCLRYDVRPTIVIGTGGGALIHSFQSNSEKLLQPNADL